MATILEDRPQGYCNGAKVYDHESSSLDSLIIGNTSRKSRYVIIYMIFQKTLNHIKYFYP
jgi:hypothetical protein